MGIPAQARRQAEAAAELQSRLINPNPEETPDNEPPAPEGTDTQPEPAPTPEPAPAAPEPTPTPPPQPASPAPAVDDVEHKYKSLQGMYNRAQQDNQQMLKRIQELEAQLRTPPAPTPEPTPPKSLITDAEREQYGPELVDLIGRAAEERARQIVAAQLAEFKPELDKTKQQVEGVANQVHQTREQEFFAAVSEGVPDWQQVDADPRWLEWLGEVDPMLGIPRQAVLDDARRKLDSARIVKIFDAFKHAAGIAPAGEPKPQQEPQKPVSPSPRPVGTAAALTPREPQQATMSRAEIADHYRRASTNSTYRGSDAYKQTEARIAQAMATNAIV